MKTVLFLPYPSTSGTWGSTLKLAAIAEECRRRGDRVVFHACPPTDALLTRRGFEVVPCPGAEPRRSPGPIDSLYDACTALGFDEPGFWTAVLRAEAEAVRSVRPDVLVSHMRLTAPVTARRHGIPLASCASWCTDPRAQARGDHQLDDLARALAADGCGLAVDSAVELVSWHADLQLASSYPAFEPELRGTPRTVYTGYLRDPMPDDTTWRRSIPQRLVLAYASSAPWGTERVIGALERAAANVGAVVWCVARGAGPAGRRSASAELFSYLPFERLMSRAAGLIFHGGQGSALAALHYGVPALAVPGRHYERRYNADRLAALGAGVHGALTDLRPSRLSAILAEMLDDDRMSRAAAAARNTDESLRGAATAVDAVHALAS
ncbi:glycosyltransferase [Lentzea sp. NPDC004789]